jgi:DNA replication protein DnaC
MSQASQPCSLCGGTGLLLKEGPAGAVAGLCSCKSPCPDCEDSGYVVRATDQGPLASRCQCQGLRNRAAAFNTAGLPAKHRSCTFEGFQIGSPTQGQAAKMLFNYAREFKPGDKGWLLYGPPGVGKTHLVCALLRRLTLERAVACRFVEFFALLADLKRAYSEGRGEAEIIAPLQASDLLVVDELGKGRGSEWELGVLDQLINHRYNNGRSTIFTTNYSPYQQEADTSYSPMGRLTQLASGGEGLEARINNRILSRIFEMCSIQQIVGEDYRKRDYAPASGTRRNS